MAEATQRVGVSLVDLAAKPWLVVGEWAAPALQLLVDSGLAERFIPEVPALAMEQDPFHHHKDVLGHSIAVMAKTDADLLLRLAWERLRKFMDTVAIELSPFFGPVFSSNPSREYLKKADVREKTFVDSELRNK